MLTQLGQACQMVRRCDLVTPDAGHGCPSEGGSRERRGEGPDRAPERLGARGSELETPRGGDLGEGAEIGRGGEMTEDKGPYLDW